MADLAPNFEFEDWVARAREVDILEASRGLGAQLKKQGHDWVGPCPACGGEDRFAVHPRKAIFLCRGGATGGVIDMVMHAKGLDFIQAVEELTGDPPPRGESKERDPEVAREMREERRDRDREREEQERAQRERKMSVAERLWEACSPIIGTHADAYLRQRRIALTVEQARDLRFYPALPYQGYATSNQDEEERELGVFPTMVAAIRDRDGQLIGAHRTYLDQARPRKLVPPGDRKRNKAKKVLGNAKGGGIWFGPPAADIVAGEGIETVLSWHSFGLGPEDLTPVSTVSLGNLAGGALGTSPHPSRASRTIPNGQPDLDRPGILLPACVRSIVLLGDGDSDPAWTRAMLLTGARRFRAEGRHVDMSMAPSGKDFGDLWVAHEEAA